MSDASTLRTRSLADIDLERTLAVIAAVVFWGWLVSRWINDWFLWRLGIGPGDGEHFADPGPIEAAGERIVENADAYGLLSGAVQWIGEFVGGIAVAADVAPILALAAWYTIIITGAGMAFGLVIAVPLSVVRVYGGRLKWVALAYIELIRGTPLLAQLFVWYFGLPLAVWFGDVQYIGTWPIPDGAFWIAIIAFTVNSSAYQAEYIRGGLESVGEGQIQAARSVGLSKLGAIRHVVLPQTLRYAIPAWTNELVYLIKYSSLAAFISVPEVYYEASLVAARTFEYTPIFAMVAVVYLGIVLTATDVMGRIERHIAIPGLGQVEGRKQGQTE